MKVRPVRKLFTTGHTRTAARRAVLRGLLIALFAVSWTLPGRFFAEAGFADDIAAQIPHRPNIHVEKYSGDQLLVEIFNNDSTQCESWILLPGENVWSTPIRGTLYFVALVYVLLGIAIISDIFMAGIEKITCSKEVTSVDPVSGEMRTYSVVVWNETVANLTLLALGSSAPEILLSTIETLSTLDSEPGELGASTIVGSAAFNLLCISAVCMWVTEENKAVKQFGVFVITTIASFFAYAWMCIVLLASSECVVSVAEGVATLAFFPLLVILAYLQDRKWYCGEPDVVDCTADDTGTNARMQELWKKLKADENISMEEAETRLAAMAETQLGVNGFSHAAYRMGAGKKRDMRRHSNTLPPPLFPDEEAPTTQVYNRRTTPPPTASGQTATIEWTSPSYTVMENEGSVRLSITRPDPPISTITVRYSTENGTAAAGTRYEETSGHIVLEEGQSKMHVHIPIIDDKQYQADEVFYVRLSDPGGGAVLGQNSVATITIVDDDIPGLLEFDSISTNPLQEMSIGDGGRTLDIVVPESLPYVQLAIKRKMGSDGRVDVRFKTTSISATEADYVSIDKTVNFSHGESEQKVDIALFNQMEYSKERVFSFEIFSPGKGASLGPLCKGQVTVTEDKDVRGLIDKVVGAAELKRGLLSEKMSSSWPEQFRAAMTIEAGEDGEGLTVSDYVLHFLTIFWKVLFAAVPPTSYGNGWATFAVALMFIGLVTALVAQLASLFGCVVGLKDPVTAITLVALGTSLPDTFASKSAIEVSEGFLESY